MLTNRTASSGHDRKMSDIFIVNVTELETIGHVCQVLGKQKSTKDAINFEK